MTEPDESYADAITPYVTEIVGEIGFHIDAQLRAALNEAFRAGKAKGKDEAAYEYAAFPEDGLPDFEEWIEEFIERHQGNTTM